MKTKREIHLAKLKDGEMICYMHAHADRAIDRLLSGLSNLQIAEWSADPDKVASARDYLIKALEDVSALRFASKEIYHRHQRIRALDKQKAEYIQEVLKKDLPNSDEVVLPRNLFTFVTKQRGSENGH